MPIASGKDEALADPVARGGPRTYGIKKNFHQSGNACYHSVQNLLSFSLLSKNLKINIYRNIILPIVLYGCETWSLTLREELKKRVFKNRALRIIFGPKRDEVTVEWGRERT